MSTWIAVILGILIGGGVIAASIAWAFNPVGLSSKPILPEARDNPVHPNDANNISGTGIDDL